ncbi:hypothetical protein HANVADRAFT_2896 [Hanseniaspora valbyensis NRRL Y-1626]|uniref:Swc3 C-terminal domain-containing protein n=1 Tax=Hanseniaspora valbyensis NRRL Y-1626 TaxID=766949 RepID=A0A1B7TCF7_9ASCO|nr:hypothetical protein HANVADRAFT_2896 [Hanseniaspora valbyensis NRRL Y-1626]
MAPKRGASRKRTLQTANKRRKIAKDVKIQEENKKRYELIAGLPIVNEDFSIEKDNNEDEIKSQNKLSIAESGVLQASLIHSIKTILFEPVIFKKYYHKIRDSHNINNNISIKIFFLKLSHLTKDYEQPYYYFMSYLNYYIDLLKAPYAKHSIKNPPAEVPHQSMNGSMHRLFDTVMKIDNFHQFIVRLFILKNDEIEDAYDIEQNKIKEVILEEREKNKELKLKAKQEKIEKQQRVKKHKFKEKEKQKQLKELEAIEKQKQKELKQIQKENQKLKREQEKIERKKEKLQREKQKKEKLAKLEEFKKKIAQIDLKRHELKEQEKKKREEHSAKWSVKDANKKEGEGEDPVMLEKELRSVEDKKMIYNLKQMGKKDEHLSKLMKNLASGIGDKEEIAEFKVFMDIARKTKVPAKWNAKEKETIRLEKKKALEMAKKAKQDADELLNNELKDIQEQRKKLQESKEIVQKEKELFLKEQEIIEQKNKSEYQTEKKKGEESNDEEKEGDKEKKDSTIEEERKENEKKDLNIEEERKENEKQDSVLEEVEKKDTVLEEKEKQQEPEIIKNTKVENEPPDDDKETLPSVDKKIKKEIESDSESFQKKKKLAYEEQLTNFQMKYSTNCDLVFEFLDNNSDRYVVPKDSIMEYDAKNSILKLSWISILNHEEISQEISKKKNIKFDYSTSMRQAFPVDILEKIGIVPNFMTNTVQFEMHWKYLPILKANLIDQREVFETMEWIIANGQRVKKHDMVYTLSSEDKDELALAEHLRKETYKYEISRSRYKN